VSYKIKFLKGAYSKIEVPTHYNAQAGFQGAIGDASFEGP
jgi:hypothetical protein